MYTVRKIRWNFVGNVLIGALILGVILLAASIFTSKYAETDGQITASITLSVFCVIALVIVTVNEYRVERADLKALAETGYGEVEDINDLWKAHAKIVSLARSSPENKPAFVEFLRSVRNVLNSGLTLEDVNGFLTLKAKSGFIVRERFLFDHDNNYCAHGELHLWYIDEESENWKEMLVAFLYLFLRKEKI